MGTSQILLIVLSVILIGVAIAAGIYMFNYQACTANRQAVIAELNVFRDKAVEYWHLPISMAGEGQDHTKGTLTGMAGYLGFSMVGSKSEPLTAVYTYNSPNGEYHLTSFDGEELDIEALGTGTLFGKHPVVTMNYNLLSEDFNLTIDTAKNFGEGSNSSDGNDD